MKITNQAHLAFISSALNRFNGYDLENDWEIKDQLKTILKFDISQRVWKQVCSVLKDNSKTVNDLQAIIFTGGKAAPSGWASKLLELIDNRIDFLTYRNKIDSMKSPDGPPQAEVIDLETYVPGAALLKDARRLLELTMRLDADGRPIPELPVDLVRLWKEKSKSWDIAGHIYNFGGIRQACLGEANDFYGNNPANIFLLRHNNHKDVAVYLGPKDIRTLYPSEIFPQEVQLINSFQEQKQTEQKSYKQKVNNMVLVRGLIEDSNDDKNIKERLLDLSRRDRTIGDKEYEFVDSAYDYVSLLWDKKYGSVFPETKLEDFLIAADNLDKVCKYVRAGGKIDDLRGEAYSNVKVVIENLKDGQIPNNDLMKLFIEMNNKLLEFQKLNLKQDAIYANKKLPPNFVENTRLEYARPASHANIRIARILHTIFGDSDIKLLDAGSGPSKLYKQAKQLFGNGSILEKIIDLDKSLSTYQSGGQNPRKVLADIAKLDDNGLPRVEAQTEIDLVKQNSFNVISTSFVMDLLEPEEIRNAIIGFENLFVKPQEDKLDLGNEAVKQYPLLCISMPENAPISDELNHALKIAGYTQYIKIFEGNKLSEVAKERIRGLKDSKLADSVENLTCKPYHLYVYLKVRKGNIEALKQLPVECFKTRNGNSWRNNIEPSNTPRDSRLINPELLEKQYAVSTLNADDFKVSETNVISRKHIVQSEPWFEKALASLEFYKDQYLDIDQKEKLTTILKKWDEEFILFLPKEEVEFVRQMSLLEIGRENMPEHLKQFEQSKSYHQYNPYQLFLLTSLEDDYRKENMMKSVLEETRKPFPERIKNIFMRKWQLLEPKMIEIVREEVIDKVNRSSPLESSVNIDVGKPKAVLGTMCYSPVFMPVNPDNKFELVVGMTLRKFYGGNDLVVYPSRIILPKELIFAFPSGLTLKDKLEILIANENVPFNKISHHIQLMNEMNGNQLNTGFELLGALFDGDIQIKIQDLFGGNNDIKFNKKEIAALVKFFDIAENDLIPAGYTFAKEHLPGNP